ncbi:MAG: YraN family protein [Coxiellaceae bacterium]|nr:YraN family protein [Coxiellaceae bacterium]
MRAKGEQKEQRAARYLQQQGLTLIESNFLCKMGEIDLIMQEGKTLVFVEVRYRQSNHYGSALESIDRNKQRKLHKTATYYLQQHNILNKVDCRFDAVCFEDDTIFWYDNILLLE